MVAGLKPRTKDGAVPDQCWHRFVGDALTSLGAVEGADGAAIAVKPVRKAAAKAPAKAAAKKPAAKKAAAKPVARKAPAKKPSA